MQPCPLLIPLIFYPKYTHDINCPMSTPITLHPIIFGQIFSRFKILPYLLSTPSLSIQSYMQQINSIFNLFLFLFSSLSLSVISYTQA